MRKGTNRLYQELAWLWPLWGDLEEYREESELFARIIRESAAIDVKSLLDIGCGGGKNAFYLKQHFRVSGIDVSEAMLSHARKLNPECDFHAGDMRSFDLNLQFDSVYMNDSVVYMTTRQDLAKAFRSAHKHIRHGGIMLVPVEYCKENFSHNRTTVSHSKAGELEVTFVENTYDPDPEDDNFEMTFIYLIREKGELRIEHDFHVGGLFPLAVWEESLKNARFSAKQTIIRLGNEDFPLYTALKP